jgi:tetratricopeptide (TPR) repeat protein
MKPAIFVFALAALGYAASPAVAEGGSTSFPGTRQVTINCTVPSCQCSFAAADGDADKALSVCSDVIADPKTDDWFRADAFVARGRAHYAKREYQGAVADETESLALYAALKKNLGGAAINRAQAYFQLGDDAKAFADFDAAVAAEPANMHFRAQRGIASLLAGKTDAALADFQAAIEGAGRGFLGGDDAAVTIRVTYTGADGYFARGALYLLAGQADQAAKDFDKSQSLEPRTGIAAIWLHYARARQGRDDAAELAANAAHLDPASREAVILKLFQGRASDTDINNVPSGPDGSDGACEGILAVAEWDRFTRHDGAGAARAYRAVAARCPRTLDTAMARAALANLPR